MRDILPLLAALLFPSCPNAVYVDVAVIGGGPGGLAAALGVKKHLGGSTVRVFERDWFEPKGASIAISAAGWKGLRSLSDVDLEPRVKASGVPITSVDIVSFGTGSQTLSGKLSRVGLAIFNGVFRAVRGVASVARRFRSRGGGQKEERGRSFQSIQMVHLWHDVRMALAEAVREECGGDQAISCGCTLVGLREVDAKEEEERGEGKGGDDDVRFELTFEKSVQGDSSSSSSSGSANQEAASLPSSSSSFVVTCGAVLACDGVGSSVRKLAPKEPKADQVFLLEGRSVWRGVSPSLDLKGKATFYRGGGDAGGGSSNRAAASSSGLVFPAGAGAGASWTVIAPEAEGCARDSADAQLRARKALEAACSGGGEGGVPDAVLADAIRSSSRVVEHRLMVRDFSPTAPPYGAQTKGLAFLGDAQHPVRPTGEGVALAWGDAAALAACCADALAASAVVAGGLTAGERVDSSGGATATAAHSSKTGAQAGVKGGGARLSARAMAEALAAYEAVRLPKVREVSEKVRASAESFYASNGGGGLSKEPGHIEAARRGM